MGWRFYRGDIVIVDFEPVKGSEQGGIRPALVIQNNIGNKYGSTTIVALITAKEFSKEFPTNVFLLKQRSGLKKDSVILLNQIKTIDKRRIKSKIKNLHSSIMKTVDMAIKVSLELI